MAVQFPDDLEGLAGIAVEAFGASEPVELAGLSQDTRQALARRAARRANSQRKRIEALQDPNADQIAGLLFGPGLAVWGWLWANRSAIWFVLKIVARILLSESDTNGEPETTRGDAARGFSERGRFPNDGTVGANRSGTGLE